MKDKIKEILDKFDKVLENYELDKKFGQMSVDSICHLFPNEMITIKDYITNLQQIEQDHQKLNGELREELEDYKSRNEKSIENIDLVIELIKQQPTEDDSWILNKLNGFKYLLNGGDDNE